MILLEFEILFDNKHSGKSVKVCKTLILKCNVVDLVNCQILSIWVDSWPNQPSVTD